MNRSMAQLSAVFTALVLLVSGGARAQTAAPQTAPPQVAPPPAEAVRPPEAAPPTPPPPGPEPRARVRSSHTVDVIAPGEKVDTILGRMHMERPATPPRNDAVRPMPGPDARKELPGPGRPGAPGRGEGRGPPHSPRTDGQPPPSSSLPPPPTR